MAGPGGASGVSWHGGDLAPSSFLTAPAAAAATSGFLLFKAATWLLPWRRSGACWQQRERLGEGKAERRQTER